MLGRLFCKSVDLTNNAMLDFPHLAFCGGTIGSRFAIATRRVSKAVWLNFNWLGKTMAIQPFEI